MAQKFQKGDVVRLRSGGPNMTVNEYAQFGYGDEKTYRCTWFDGKKKLEVHTFAEEELEKVRM